KVIETSTTSSPGNVTIGTGPSTRRPSFHVEGFERDVERLGRVRAVPGVERGAAVLDWPALLEVVAHGFLASVVEHDDRDVLALRLAVDDRLAPVEELLGRGEVPDHLQPALLLAPRAEAGHSVVAVVVLDQLVLMFDPVDGV